MVNPRKQRSYDKGNYPDVMNELEQKDWSSILSESEVIDTNWKKIKHNGHFFQVDWCIPDLIS
jgi:hypothetical protein